MKRIIYYSLYAISFSLWIFLIVSSIKPSAKSPTGSYDSKTSSLKKPSENSSAYDSTNIPGSSSRPSVKNSSNVGLLFQTTPGDGSLPSEEKPPVGKDVLLMPLQLRYCRYEIVRLEEIRKHINKEGQVDMFNKAIDDYNSRCGSYKYNKMVFDSISLEVFKYRDLLTRQAMERSFRFK